MKIWKNSAKLLKVCCTYATLLRIGPYIWCDVAHSNCGSSCMSYSLNKDQVYKANTKVHY